MTGFRTLFFFLAFLLLCAGGAAAETDCAKLSREQCLASNQCALDYCQSDPGQASPPKGCYQCRKRIARCEVGFSHASVEKRRAECEARGCGVRVDCYCPCEDPKHPKYGKCVCQCMGGLPANCIERPPGQ